jgi:hypothetical protein
VVVIPKDKVLGIGHFTASQYLLKDAKVLAAWHIWDVVVIYILYPFRPLTYQ